MICIVRRVQGVLSKKWYWKFHFCWAVHTLSIIGPYVGVCAISDVLLLWRLFCISVTLMAHPCLTPHLSTSETYVFLFLTQDWNKCYVGCEFGFSASKTPDATFGIAPDPSVDGILRSMESSQYYSENNIDVARGWVRTKLFWSVISYDFFAHLNWHSEFCTHNLNCTLYLILMGHKIIYFCIVVILHWN